MAIKGMEPAPNPQYGEGAKSSKGAHLSLLPQRQNMNGNVSTVQGTLVPDYDTATYGYGIGR